MGEDAQGITRGFFSDFWEEFCKVYVDGGNLSIAPDKMLPVEHIKSLGRIFVAGFITTGFIPPSINNALLYRLLCGKMPSAGCYIFIYRKLRRSR